MTKTKLHLVRDEGDEIYWTDPEDFYRGANDETCSGYGFFVEYINKDIARIKKDGSVIEVFISELS
tara:strand:+ start:359 stop:556 length:198 start_codon:yes stop_codon:yes gene_type:complete